MDIQLDAQWLKRCDRDMEDFIIAEHKRKLRESWTGRIEADKVFKTAVWCAILAILIGLASFTALQWLWD